MLTKLNRQSRVKLYKRSENKRVCWLYVIQLIYIKFVVTFNDIKQSFKIIATFETNIQLIKKRYWKKTKFRK